MRKAALIAIGYSLLALWASPLVLGMTDLLARFLDTSWSTGIPWSPERALFVIFWALIGCVTMFPAAMTALDAAND